MKVQALQGDTVDLLCWRHYGRTQGIVEQVLQVNPNLVEGGIQLAAGQWVELPELAPVAKQEMIQLWD
ncbi:tail protein X [Providencia rettgeri]|uniref:tail protein X n=1 Tax=Providencia rettgeri TaxID=587 RepID=UPI001B38FCEF|nr:tail protein X [Providencia rettgeri]MBQ0398681.1 tail protein X [Providencia rettgeri]